MARAAQARKSALAQPGEDAPSGAGARLARALGEALARGEIEQGDHDLALERLGLRRNGARAQGERRGDIINAAIRIFLQKGYHAATLQDIADELGLTRPAFYYYFKSKQEILEAICHGAADGTDASIDTAIALPAVSHAEALRRVLQSYGRHICAQDTTAIMMRNYEEMSAEQKAAINARRSRRERKVLDLLKRGIAAGELAADHPHIALNCIFEAIHAMHYWYRPQGALSREAAVDVVVELFMRGLTRQG